MSDSTIDRLKALGYTAGTPAEFFGVTDEVRRLAAEQQQIEEFRVRLGQEIRRRRTEARLNQTELADRVGSKQTRIARIEASKPGVSIESMLSAYLATGGTMADLGAFILVGVPASQVG